MHLTMTGEIIGGLGLFILGMLMMTEGLKLCAGHTLRSILTSSTRTPLRGILSGTLITSMVQSSSAVTVATIGFVNAGLLTLNQAVLLIYGSNIGTTMTGWLVALVGFHVNIKAFALPLVGIGMLLRIIAGNRHLNTGAGEALAGFGIFFLGIEVLKNAFAGIEGGIHIEMLASTGFPSQLLFTGVGVLLTFLMQSSSAAMAFVLTAAGGGELISLNAAAAVVIGANLGTTTTAILATVGATANAKRVAAAHVAFNLVTGILAMLLLPWILPPLVTLVSDLHTTTGPATVLALFHTFFNLAGVLLFLPASARLVAFLESRFQLAEEDEGIPRFLDKNVVTTPALGLHAMAQELIRIGQIARRMAMAAISSEHHTSSLQLKEEKIALNRLIEALGEFSTLLRRRDLAPKQADQLPVALRISRYYQAIAELALEVSKHQGKKKQVEQPELAGAVAFFKKKVVHLLEETDASLEGYSPAATTGKLLAINNKYQEVKSALLRAGAVGQLTTRTMVAHLEVLSEIRRIADQAEKGARFLSHLLQFPDQTPIKEKTSLGEESRE